MLSDDQGLLDEAAAPGADDVLVAPGVVAALPAQSAPGCANAAAAASLPMAPAKPDVESFDLAATDKSDIFTNDIKDFDEKMEEVQQKMAALKEALNPQVEGEAGEAGVLRRSAKYVAEKSRPILEHEKVQKSVQYVVDKSKALAEHEKVQRGVHYVAQKANDLSESERVQKSLAAAQAGAKVVSERTQQGMEYAKDKSKAVREGVVNVWAQGRGRMERVRANVGKLAWKGSARDTLDIAARQEQWSNIKVQGAEELSVPARTEHTCCYHVSKGSTLRWCFRVKEHDIGFGVRMRVQQWGGSREEEVLPIERYDSADTVSGSWVADEDRTMVLVYDNRYSKLRAKTVAYIVGTDVRCRASEPATTASLEPAMEITETSEMAGPAVAVPSTTESPRRAIV